MPSGVWLSGWPPPDEPYTTALFGKRVTSVMAQTYVAVEGDDLFSICRRFYGNEDRDNIAKIAAASGIFDANDVQPGQIVVIP